MRVIVTGGGTGGHIYPAIAIADKFKEMDPETEILYVGNDEGIEKDIVPKSGYDLAMVDARWLDKSSVWQLVKTGARVAKGTLEANRVIRKFKPDMPEKAELEQIIESGLYAASAKGKQSAIILAVTNKELRDRIAEENRRIGGFPEGFDPFYGAPAVLIVLAEKEWANRVYDGSLVMGNMMLAAHSLGLGSIWIHRAKQEFEDPEYRQLLKDLGVEGEWEGIGHCAVGYIDGEIPQAAERKPNRVFWAE